MHLIICFPGAQSTHCSSLPWATTGQSGHPGLWSTVPKKGPECSCCPWGRPGAQGSGFHYPGNKRSHPELQQVEWLMLQRMGLQPFPTSISQGLSTQEPSE